MKMFNKTLLAAALLAATGAANATLVTDSTTGGNEAFLSVFDATQQKTFNLDMGVTFAEIVANPSTAFAAFSGAGFNLGADSNWNSFVGGITNAATVKYAVFAGSTSALTAAVNNSIAVTGINAIVANAADPTVLIGPAADRINQHANQINIGMGAANSSLINQLPEDPAIGQMDLPALQSNEIWGGWTHNPSQAYGSSVDFWLAGYHVEMIDDGFDIVPTNVFTAADVTKLGSFTLAGSSLKFASASAPASVPLPAAVWMFGAGLMGILRLNRRKSA